MGLKFCVRKCACARSRKIAPEELMAIRDIDMFESRVFGNMPNLVELQRQRYCPNVEIRMHRDKQFEMIEKIKNDRDRQREQNADDVRVGNDAHGFEPIDTESLWVELHDAYQKEQELLQETQLHYHRQIFMKPTMTGLTSSNVDNESPYDHDETVERTFFDHERADDQKKKTAATAEEPRRRKKSLYHNYLDTLEEENHEQAATEKDVRRLLVGKVTDMQDKLVALQRMVEQNNS